MRKKIIIISILSTLWLYGKAQGYYYDAWFDNNLGTMTHGTVPFGENELSLDLSAITSPGLHFLNIIPYYEWGEMGVWKCIPFVMPEGWPGNQEPGSIEYWVTGYDSKPKTKPYGDEATALDIDISGMSCGLHFLNYRVFTKSGYPSPWKIIPFYLSNDTFGKEEMQYEYWIDAEETHKTGVGIMPGALDLVLDPSSLSDGEHTFHFKAGNLFGNYGEDFTTTFYVLKGELSLIKNPNIVATSKTNIPNWTCTRTAQNGNTKDASGDTFFEVWNPTPASILFDYYQDIELTNGVYRLESSVFNSTTDVSGATVNEAVGLYAQTNQHEWFTPVSKDCVIEDVAPSVADGIIVTDGHLRVGVRNRNVMSARWAGADDFLLTYLGTTQEVFGKSEKDALIYSEGKQIGTWPANPDGSRDASILIFNSDANSALTTGWTASNVKPLKGEAWDGDNANSYFDFCKTSAYTSSLEQELKLLPAGDYTLSLMVRCSEGAQMTVTATSGSNQVSKTYTGIGNVSPSYSHFEKGWQLFTLPAVSVASGGSLKIQVTASMAANQWWSADDFKLSWTGNTPIIDDGNSLRGDVNGDGEVNVGDLVSVSNYMAGDGSVSKEAADVNEDGEVNVGDMVVISNIMSGNE